MKDGAEIEAKYRLKPGDRERLVEMLGIPTRRLDQVDRYFEVPGRVLRLRRENGAWLLTRKDPTTIDAQGYKSRHEIELALPAGMEQVLEDLIQWLGHGFRLEVRKERLEFERSDHILCLDRIASLERPDFLELESKGADSTKMAAIARSLGLGPEQMERKSYATMVAKATGVDLSRKGTPPARPGRLRQGRRRAPKDKA
ncbi:MAG: class IV adenylate cyclase [Candidatus Sericytochromatia bacterium]|nr:class IV adenylate cyclase [Candidatus Sericytochromatia bacterium]